MKKLLAVIIVVVFAGIAFYARNRAEKNNAAAPQPPDTIVQEVDPRVDAAAKMLFGTWSNEEDRNVIREYKNDTTVVDNDGSINGEMHTVASWSLFTGNTAPTDVAFQLNNQDVYVRHRKENGTVMTFRIVSITPTELELMNMETGVSQRFGKMPTGQELQDGIED